MRRYEYFLAAIVLISIMWVIFVLASALSSVRLNPTCKSSLLIFLALSSL